MKILIAAALALSAASASAEDLDPCAYVGGFAEAIMLGRQNGAPMSQYMAAANQSMDKAVGGVVKELVIQAYQLPRFSTPQMQRRSIQEFRASAEVSCYSR